MVDTLILDIKQAMSSTLTNGQMEKLHKVLAHYLYDLEITKKEGAEKEEKQNIEYLEAFLSAKHVEGCSRKSLKYYKATIENLFKKIDKSIKHITTNDLREYLDNYQKEGNASKITIDNIRVKTGTVVKETYSDEAMEIMRDNCKSLRDLAIIDMLASTGMRVGELVKLNIEDIDFEGRECVVFGKGDKERKVYFDARTKIHLHNYLKTRDDDNSALFVSLLKPYKRLQISGVEIMLRQLGRKLNITKVHPHKFRRTLATKAIDKGMPIEQVQQLLGHQKIDTTLQYAMVSQNNVKISHRKYIG